ncbi:hypothetical protein [Streptomyces leeuwenhoekii]|uniref:Lipoprotein n=1 Tax=Streptomyces leeuwenhoekii TaxID=1437453 RepID=A0A0F7VNX9_STRLW|nr:hypothetical protein [Streptomyces leeuwenhoekii]KMS72512.1 lipoprotein [Streptomyces leeuwenhoekii]CQR61440.1 Hypothetical Protein sle_19790 [Streptomyces leeuwenhoekii]
MPPFTSSPRTRPGPRRRSLLASAAGAALLAGCSAGPGSDGTGGSPAAAARVRARAARDSEWLAARYDAVIAAHPGLAARLRPLREEVVRHAEAFGGGTAPAPRTSPAQVSPSASPPAAVPGNEKDALAGLAAAERELAGRRTGALADVPGELARLLASVAAAGAAHVYLLTEDHG